MGQKKNKKNQYHGEVWNGQFSISEKKLLISSKRLDHKAWDACTQWHVNFTLLKIKHGTILTLTKMLKYNTWK